MCPACDTVPKYVWRYDMERHWLDEHNELYRCGLVRGRRRGDDTGLFISAYMSMRDRRACAVLSVRDIRDLASNIGNGQRGVDDTA